MLLLAGLLGLSMGSLQCILSESLDSRVCVCVCRLWRGVWIMASLVLTVYTLLMTAVRRLVSVCVSVYRPRCCNQYAV